MSSFDKSELTKTNFDKKRKETNSETKGGIIVEGYIRSNFADDCWVNEVVQIIFQYYVCKGGSLYMFGDGRWGCLGIQKYFDKICAEPTLCPPFNDMNVLDVVADRHTMILDVDGQVWSCGQGMSGQLGNGIKKDAPWHQKVKLTQPVIGIAVGDSHSLVLLQNGYVQSFGSGMSGALGHGNDESVLFPKTIKALKKHKIIKITADGYHSCVLAKNGDLFCFGKNHKGQCGVGEEKGKKIMIPTKVKFEKKVVLIACGSQHTLLITSDGLIYSFGDGDGGRLGHGSEENKYVPTLIETLKKRKIKKCAAGFWHSICIDEDGVLWAFGISDKGQCGFGWNFDQHTPKVIEYFVSNNIKATDCAVGWQHSAVLSDDGSLYMFGRNESHELGLEDRKSYWVPTKLPIPENMSVKKVAGGCNNTALILQ